MSQKKNYAFGRFPPLRIASACESWLEQYDKNISQKIEERISELTAPTKKFSFWRGFVITQKTREEAIAILDYSEMFFSERAIIERAFGRGWLNDVHALLRMALLCKAEFVEVDSELFSLLAPHYRKEDSNL